MLKECVNYF